MRTLSIRMETVAVARLTSRNTFDGGLLARILVLVIAATNLLFALAHAATTGYVYDERGRVVSVDTGEAGAANYTYDPAGNIKRVQTVGSATVAIAEFTPDGGPAGATVRISGRGFVATPSSNTVTFNGVAATVTAASTTQLIATVPTAATTGKIVVSNANGSATSATDFAVGATGQPPTLSGFSPANGAAGTIITVTGTNFDAVAANNQVYLNDLQTQVVTASATQLTVRVPANATSGRIAVVTTSGRAVSSSDFMVIPNGQTAASVVLLGRVTVDAALAGFTVPASKSGMVLVDLAEGEAYSIYLPAGTSYPARIFGPGTGDQTLSIGILNRFVAPRSGTYSLLLGSFASATSVQVSVARVVRGVLTVDSGQTAVSLPAYRLGEYAFAGSVNQRLSLGITGVTGSSSTYLRFTLFDPQGINVSFSCSSYNNAPAACVLPPLPRAGTYTLRVAPGNLTSAVSTTLTLSNALTGSLMANATPTSVAWTRPGQYSRYTFSASAGDNHTLLLSSPAYGTSGSGTVLAYVYKPGNGYYTYQSIASTATTPAQLNLPNLPETGTYTVEIKSSAPLTGSVQVQLSANGTTPPVSVTYNGTIVTDGASLLATIPAGAKHKYRLDGTAGQNLSLGITGVTVSSGSLFVYLDDPFGRTLTSCPSSNGINVTCRLPRLPASGAYTLRVEPATAGASASATLTLSSPIGGALPADGTPTTVAWNRPGQFARYAFNADASASLTLLASNGTLSASDTRYVDVFDASGTRIAYTSTYYSGSGSVPSLELNLDNLAGGEYSVEIRTASAATGSVQLALRSDASAASLAVDGAPLAVSVAAGQDGRYTFAGTAGHDLSLGLTGTTVSSGNLYVYLDDPFGRNLTSFGCTASSGVNMTCRLPRLPASGTYTLRVELSNVGASAATTLTLSSPIGDTLPTDGTPKTVVWTRPGQFARYSFNAGAGASYTLLASNGTLSASGVFYLEVFTTDGTPVASTSLYYSGSGVAAARELNLDYLAGGIYRVEIRSDQATTGSVQLALRGDASAAGLAVNGAPLAVSVAAGQDARYTFAGTLGQDLSIGLTGVTVSSGYLFAYLDDPFGRSVDNISCNASSGTNAICRLPRLPASGTYTLRVEPYIAGASASATLTLSAPVDGTLAVDALPVAGTIGRFGQPAKYSLAMIAGQTVDFEVTGLATTPAGTGVVMEVRDVAGNVQRSCNLGTAVTSPASSCRFAATVPGTYEFWLLPANGASATWSIRAVSQ